ncbi:MAG: Chaperone protein TorD [Anaerolineales bacterium]|nr:Chaperone protein TorD [Anaerolineales bacterium]HAX70208.1 hypothetical protein [Anaerolineae bacterium]HRJ55724.1 molecular chaperone TorD family protein [Anaerolineales bacterium]HRK88114.1 molecular chaperone TorD family protein [Anaerolineales bacterium]
MLNPVSVSDPFQNAFGILTQVARDRGCVYRWLALGFYAPDEELVRSLREGLLKQELTQATYWLGMDQRPLSDCLNEVNAYANASLPELQAAYEALFGKNVSRIAARESAYLWRSVTHPADAAGELDRALINIYRQYGLKPQTGAEDSLSVQLEFIAYLCQLETQAWQAGTSQTARELRRQERAFLADHLGRWLPEFCQRVEERALPSFYTALSAFAFRWTKLEYGPGYSSLS